MIAVTNSAVESCWTARSAAQRRDHRQVRQQREAEHDPGHDPADDEQRRAGRGLEDRELRDDEGDPDEPPEGGSQELNGSDHESLDWPRPGSGRVDRRASTIAVRSCGRSA